MYKSIALVDLSYLVTRHFKARAATTPPPQTVVLAAEVTNAVLNDLAATREGVEHVILCLDAPPYFRKEMYPEYKGTRKEQEPELKSIKRTLLERLDADGWNMARVESFEADDLIATLCNVYTLIGCPDIRILSADKDCAQCVTANVRMFVPKRSNAPEQILGPTDVVKKFGVTPAMMPLYLAMVGDVSDNIPGVEKVGAKTAATWINAVGGDVSKLGAQLAIQKAKGDKCPATWRYFGECYPEKLALWTELATLRTDVNVDAAALLVKRQPKPLTDAGSDIDGDDPFGHEETLDGDEPVDWEAVEEQVTKEQAAANAADVFSAPPKRSCDNHSDCDIADRNDRAWAEKNGINPQSRNIAHPRTGKTPPIIGKDPNAEAVLKEQAAARAAEKAPPKARTTAKTAAAPPTMPGAGSSTTSTGDATTKSESASVAPGASSAGEAPKAAAAPATPQNGAPTQSAADTAGSSQAAPKPKRGATAKLADDIRVADAQFENATVQPPPAPLAIVRAEVPWELQLQPSSAAETLAIAKHLFESRHLLAYGTAHGVANVIFMGRELGIGMQAALNGFFIVEGKPYASAKLIRALCQKHSSICKYLVCTHSDAASATWETVRHGVNGGKPMQYTYDRQRAELAGYYTGKNQHNWKTKEQEMISKTACSKGCWQWYADLLLGLPQDDEFDAPGGEP